MSPQDAETEHLFSYGTLQTEAVQLATFGRRLEGRPDSLVGYRLATVRIDDAAFAAVNGAIQRIIQFTGDSADVVEGATLTVTTSELQQADDYEPDGYERVPVLLRSGTRAWVYVDARQRDLRAGEPDT